jgi:hypothetical protein
MDKLQWKEWYRQDRIEKWEIWKDLEWYEWKYQVSSLWKIKILKNRYWKTKMLNPAISTYWYRVVWLWKDWIWKQNRVNRIIASTFIPNTENKREVNHINGIKIDDRVENLEWCTPGENQKHAYKIWLKVVSDNHNFKTNHPSKWKFWKLNCNSNTILQYDKKWIFIKEWWSALEILRELKIDNSSIWRCCSWKLKTSWWFIWKFKKTI